MAHDAQTERLYDYLYRDSARIASYYAQIFGGHLTSVEETDSDRGTLDKTLKGGVPVVSGEVKSAKETLTSLKQVFSPHDLITVDVLATLASQDRIHADLQAAPHGSLVMCHGTLVWVDRHILEMALVVFEGLVAEEKKKPRHQRNKQMLQGAELVKAFLERIPLPSAFLLHADDGRQVAGTIKEAGMEEPISTYYFKHGTAGLTGVHLIGIKEVPTLSFTLPNTQLIGAGQQAAQALSDMLFPKEATRVTPIALFRKL